MKKEIPIIGIIGCGPRGLSALESLYAEATKHSLSVKVIVFEPAKYPGAGPVYDLEQMDSNWLNVSERSADIPARKGFKYRKMAIPAFPDFQDWSGYSGSGASPIDRDRFPLRSTLGRYLHERYRSIAEILLDNGLLQYVDKEVIHLEYREGQFQITTVAGTIYYAKEAILCVGHQPIELEDSLMDWKNSVPEFEGLKLYTTPYPLSDIIAAAQINANGVVAIRGFGLAMIDVMRALTEGLGGTFEGVGNTTRAMVYVPSGKEVRTIIPFSLDGLPLAPKPLNKKLDDRYAPSEEELESYITSVKQSMECGPALQSTDFLVNAIAPLIVNKYLDLGKDAISHSRNPEQLRGLVRDWFTDPDLNHGVIVSKNLTAQQMLVRFLGMATGHEKVSLDFCIGQVWRHCQPSMYKLLAFAPLSDELISDIISLDERLKRYSYGPPVDSLQQLLALVRAGRVNLDYVRNPDIHLNAEGWSIHNGKESVTVKVMINSVLDAPQILKVVSPLPKGLIKGGLAEPMHNALGIRTEKDATIEKINDNSHTPALAILGRLAKGSLIGVDAIAECFGDRPELWAKGVIDRLLKRT